jgi:hypothetical protein
MSLEATPPSELERRLQYGLSVLALRILVRALRNIRAARGEAQNPVDWNAPSAGPKSP